MGTGTCGRSAEPPVESEPGSCELRGSRAFPGAHVGDLTRFAESFPLSVKHIHRRSTGPVLVVTFEGIEGITPYQLRKELP